MADVPHFALPFRFASPQVAVNEQDSLGEVADACLAILVCPVGFRIELPAFGLEDPTFSSPAPDLDTVREALDQWEPRAAATMSSYPDLLDTLISHVEVDVRVRTED